MNRLTAADRADLRDLVHVLAQLMGCAQEQPLVAEKMCSKCRCVLPAAEFTRDRHRISGLSFWCRRCQKYARLKKAPNGT